MKLTKAERCANLRFRKPALANMGYFDITEGLQEIQDECDRIHWWIDNDQDLLVDALNGEEEAFNFRFAFSDLESDCMRMQKNLMQLGWKFSNYEDEYDDDDEEEAIHGTMSIAFMAVRMTVTDFGSRIKTDWGCIMYLMNSTNFTVKTLSDTNEIALKGSHSLIQRSERIFHKTSRLISEHFKKPCRRQIERG